MNKDDLGMAAVVATTIFENIVFFTPETRCRIIFDLHVLNNAMKKYIICETEEERKNLLNKISHELMDGGD